MPGCRRDERTAEPNWRLQRVAVELVQELITARRPHITQAMKRVNGEREACPQAKRGYRLAHTKRVPTRPWTTSLVVAVAPGLAFAGTDESPFWDSRPTALAIKARLRFNQVASRSRPTWLGFYP